MEEQLISFETAKLAKEKGFDCKVRYSYGHEINPYIPYPNSDFAISCNFNSPNIGRNWKHLYSAPTQALFQKWLREVYNIVVNIEFSPHFHWERSLYTYTLEARHERILKLIDKIPEDFTKYTIYEEALEKGLQEGLKLIK